MKKNMGILDTKIRMALAVVIAILYFAGTISGFYGIVILAAAVLLVFDWFGTVLSFICFIRL